MKVSEIIKKGEVDIKAIERLIEQNNELHEQNIELEKSFGYQRQYVKTYLGSNRSMVTFFRTKEELTKHICDIIASNSSKNEWMSKITLMLSKSRLFRLLFKDIYQIIKKA